MQRLKVGDLVKVIAGSEKGKTGTIKKILKDDERVVIEGLNMVTKHQKPNQRNQEGGKIQMEAPIHASNVMPVDPDTKNATRVKIQERDGKKIRVAKSGAEIKSE
jgi:large subunit ribosomal protein L24